jgi:4-amino-4-deoxy-L-arabinose transferase-like glycosyltransferase
VGGIALVLVYVGPHLYGTDWYYIGYGLGVFIGSFGWMAYVRMTETEKKDARWRQNQTSLVVVMLLLIGLLVMLATRH